METIECPHCGGVGLICPLCEGAGEIVITVSGDTKLEDDLNRQVALELGDEHA